SYSLNKKSRVTGDCHARFCERLELECSGLLDSFLLLLHSLQNTKKKQKIRFSESHSPMDFIYW
ncbi:hypothetical protein, partial [Bacteroides luti]|uniref:hypothetical protein n=1 Tax=Bacteroides luti TaxID=1297750 RepID=UPI001C31CE66